MLYKDFINTACHTDTNIMHTLYVSANSEEECTHTRKLCSYEIGRQFVWTAVIAL